MDRNGNPLEVGKYYRFIHGNKVKYVGPMTAPDGIRYLFIKIDPLTKRKSSLPLSAHTLENMMPTIIEDDYDNDTDIELNGGGRKLRKIRRKTRKSRKIRRKSRKLRKIRRK